MWIKLPLNFVTSIQNYSSSYFQESDRIKADRDLIDLRFEKVIHITCASLLVTCSTFHAAKPKE
jgi:hypothetical protein